MYLIPGRLRSLLPSPCYKSAICPGFRFLIDFLARFMVRVPLAAFWGLLRASLGRLRGLLAAGAGAFGFGGGPSVERHSLESGR